MDFKLSSGYAHGRPVSGSPHVRAFEAAVGFTILSSDFSQPTDLLPVATLADIEFVPFDSPQGPRARALTVASSWGKVHIQALALWG